MEGGVRPDGHVSATEVVVNRPDPMLRRLQVSLGDLLCVLFLQEKEVKVKTFMLTTELTTVYLDTADPG